MRTESLQRREIRREMRDEIRRQRLPDRDTEESARIVRHGDDSRAGWQRDDAQRGLRRLNPEERQQLRREMEDAVRELYPRR